jgi:uncharacterized protein YbjT (DUF2867 family)
MILVIGGRSKIGSALIGRLSSSGQEVKALVRESENRQPMPDQVEAVSGDLADADSIRRAMDGVDRVFLLCGPAAQEVDLNRNAFEAANDAGIEFLVRSSILGADPDSDSTFARDHGVCDAGLAASGVRYAIVRPNLFTQNIAENTMPSIGADGTFYANAGEARISMVDTRDVAAVAAGLLMGPVPENDRIYNVTGREALSYADVADKLSRHLGRDIKYVDVPDASVREALLGLGLGEWMSRALVELYVDYKRSGQQGYAAEVSDTIESITGRPPRTLDELLAEIAPTE